jgi:hypothetical protein
MPLRALAVVACVLAFAGCGGGRLSEEEFTARATAICGDVNKGLREIEDPASMEDLAATLDEGLVVVDDGLDELRDLKPPEALDARYDAWLAKVQESADELAKARDAVKREDQAAVGLALQSGDDANVEANRLAAALGLRACAED